MKDILEMLEHSAQKYPQKNIFCGADNSFTYADFLDKARNLGTAIAKKGINKKPIALIFERSVENLIAMCGVLYSGNFYTVIDSEMPADRVKSIFDTLQPAAVLASVNCSKTVSDIEFGGKVIYYEKAVNFTADKEILERIRCQMVDTDPAYALFTSGSTGVPKGAIVNHRSVLAYIKWYARTFDITSETVFGSQTPFYFSMSVSDVYSTMYSGATLHVIPKSLFSFPMKLLEFLNERRINTVYWVPSALCIIANWRVLDYGNAEYLKKVLFAGEVMPVKQLNYWISKMPDVMYANLFGPTETTDICTYYIVDRKFDDTESLPIGKHCDNCDVFVVNEKGEEAKPGEEGELYARGSFLAMGYYNNPEKTKAAFVQNPLNSAYPETVYKTGDLVKYNDQGELIYLSRIDFQIKHMGYRIELGEIEAASGAISDIKSCAVIYDSLCDKIVFIYQGKQKDTAEMADILSKRLPTYMMPDQYVRVKNMPYNQNGKIDRIWLMKNYKTI